MTETGSGIPGAITRAVWGYFFLYFNIHIGTVNLLPAFVGWLLFLSALRGLEAERRDLKLLRPYAHVMALLGVLEWLGSLLGLSLGGLFLPLDLLLAAAGLYFHFQFLTDCAALAGEHAAAVLRRRLLFWRTVQAVMQTASALLACLRPGPGEWEAAAAVLAVNSAAVCLCIMAALHTLRRFFPA